MKSILIGVIAAASLQLFDVQGACAEVPSPEASPASPPTIVKYRVMERGSPPGESVVTITHGQSVSLIAAKSTVQLSVAGAPYSAAGPTYRFLTSTTESKLTLGADLAPTTYTNIRHVDGPNDFIFDTFTATGAQLYASGRRRRSIALEDGTKHFAILDGADLAGLVALPLQLSAWHDANVTAVYAQTTDSKSLAVSSTVPASRPKGVPEVDVVYALDGKEHVVEWVDPVTMIPDRIDLLTARAVIVRAGLPY